MRPVTVLVVALLFARSAYLAFISGSASPVESAPARSALPVAVREYVNDESAPALFRVLYQYGENVPARDGAYGPNISATPGSWYLEYQRAGAVDVIGGVLRGDVVLVDDGLRMFTFGLKRENAAGRFPGSAWPFHGTAMFLAEAAPSLIVLKYSRFESKYASQLRWQIGRMHRAAVAMVRAVGGPGRIDDPTKEHRLFEAALALQATGVLSTDPRLEKWAQRYAREAIVKTQPDGVMPEDGGHDSGYQALGLTHAIRYLTLIHGTSMARALPNVLQRAVSWEASRVNADGSVNQQGDTRTSGCREKDPTGKCKTTFYAPIFNALTRWAVMTHDSRLERKALLVWLKNWAMVRGDVLPSAGLFARPISLRAGDWLTVWGTRYQPLESVRVYFGGRLEEQVKCDQIGSFGGHSPLPNAHFQVPAVHPGNYTVEARGSEGTDRRTDVQILG